MTYLLLSESQWFTDHRESLTSNWVWLVQLLADPPWLVSWLLVILGHLRYSRW